jgi:N-acetylglutamate synthase-like GNAT family acetyltransferase
VAELQNIEIALAETAELTAIQSFYSNVGYSCGLNTDDRILVARQDRSIVAAVRLSWEADTLVLRGMYVAEPLRGAGIGSKMLERISAEIGSPACWCVPYTHLEDFYSRIGFSVCEGAEIPEFLAARMKRYASAGRKVTIMNRPEGWVSRSW